jgi:hypothetical protein
MAGWLVRRKIIGFEPDTRPIIEGEMQKAGGIISLIAGIFGVLAAIVTLSVGGIAGAFKADGASTVVGLGWGGILFSFLCIIFGAIAISAKTKLPAVLLILSAIAGTILGGTLVAVFMVLALAGGIVALLKTERSVLTKESETLVSEHQSAIQTAESVSPVSDKPSLMRWAIPAAVAVIAFLVVFNISGRETANRPPERAVSVNGSPSNLNETLHVRPATAAPTPATTQLQPEIRINGFKCNQSSASFMTVEGELRNISSSPIKDLMVVASHYGSDGTFIKSDSAMVEYNPLMPGQTSPFKTISTFNPLMKRCKVEFKRIGGAIVKSEN